HLPLHSFPTRRSSDLSFNSFCPPRSVALSRADRHVKASGCGRVELRALLAFALQAIRIAKATGLHLLHSRIHRRNLRAAGIEIRSEEHTSELQSRFDL